MHKRRDDFMISKTRTTAMGTEYWDNVAKKVLFVPTGKKPNFEVNENTDSVISGVDLSKKKIEGIIINTQNDINLDEMNVKQLLSFAKDNDIDVPGNMKKEETIRNHIAEHLTAADE